MKLEISTYNIEGVISAHKLGANRVELCDNIKEGGTTPSYGFIKQALEIDHPEVFVIIRPRGGDFLYSDAEFQIIKDDIIEAKKLGVDGVVCGVLLSDGNIDKVRTKELINLARPMKFTFHRAFDMSKSYQNSINDLIEIGVDIVLTSGMKDKAIDGIYILKELVEISKGRIEILAGSGVNSENIAELSEKANITNFHMSAIKYVNSEMKYFNNSLNMGNIESEEYTKLTVDSDKIMKAVEVINNFKQKA
jgi:copper homeostasis protein